MIRMRQMLIILFFGYTLFSGIVFAQKPEFQFSLQSWASYTTYDYYNVTETILEKTTTQFGFGIRRARLRGKMTNGKFAAFIQYDAVSNVIRDVHLDYSFSDQLKLRMGRFVGPSSQAAGRISHTALDFTERAIVGRMYSTSVHQNDHRSYGASLIGKAGFLNYEIMASNGDGSLNLKPYNTRSSNSDKDTGLFPQMDFMVYTNMAKSVSVGIHYRIPNQKRINVSATTAYLYFHPKDYKKGDLRAKVDFVHIEDKILTPIVKSFGYRALAFYRLTNKIEIGIKHEQWDTNVNLNKDAFGNITVGINFSPNPDHWKDSLFKLDVIFKTAQAENAPKDPVIIHFMWQLYVH